MKTYLADQWTSSMKLLVRVTAAISTPRLLALFVHDFFFLDRVVTTFPMTGALP